VLRRGASVLAAQACDQIDVEKAPFFASLRAGDDTACGALAQPVRMQTDEGGGFVEIKGGGGERRNRW
jgi:hypothetical protein